MPESPIERVAKFDFQAEYSVTGAVALQIATVSECRYRWLHVPATTFIITHSPSRSNRRDGSVFWVTQGKRLWVGLVSDPVYYPRCGALLVARRTHNVAHGGSRIAKLNRGRYIRRRWGDISPGLPW